MSGGVLVRRECCMHIEQRKLTTTINQLTTAELDVTLSTRLRMLYCVLFTVHSRADHCIHRVRLRTRKVRGLRARLRSVLHPSESSMVGQSPCPIQSFQSGAHPAVGFTTGSFPVSFL